MRELLLEYIKGLKLAGFNVSNDLPYTSSGEELYIKNVKRIYVDQEQHEQVPFITVLSSQNIDSNVTTISVYFTTDAKQLPSNYKTAVSAIKGLKEMFMNTHFVRECSVSTELQADLQVTTLEFRLTSLIKE